MGRDIYCDLCRSTVALETALQKVVIGETVVGEVCLTCASQLGHGIKEQITAAATAVNQAKVAAQAQAEAAAAAVPAEQAPSVGPICNEPTTVMGD